MSQVLERLRSTPISRTTESLEEENVMQKRSFDRLNNIRNSFQKRQSVLAKEKAVPGAGVNMLEVKQSSKYHHSDLHNRNDTGFDMFKRLSPFKTSMRKRKCTEESIGDYNSPEVKVRILESGCEAYSDLDFMSKVRESSLLIGWMNGNSNKTVSRKQLIFEDKDCEHVDLDFGLYLREDYDDCLDDNVNLYSDQHLPVHHKSASLSSDVCLDDLHTDLDFRQSKLHGGLTRSKSGSSLTSLSEGFSSSTTSSISSLSEGRSSSTRSSSTSLSEGCSSSTTSSTSSLSEERSSSPTSSLTSPSEGFSSSTRSSISSLSDASLFV